LGFCKLSFLETRTTTRDFLNLGFWEAKTNHNDFLLQAFSNQNNHKDFPISSFLELKQPLEDFLNRAFWVLDKLVVITLGMVPTLTCGPGY
jgi:hypothetical protein